MFTNVCICYDALQKDFADLQAKMGKKAKPNSRANSPFHIVFDVNFLLLEKTIL